MENSTKSVKRTQSSFGITELVTREVRPDDKNNPSDLYLGGIHAVRTSKWEYVISLSYNMKHREPISMRSTPEQPIYICDAYRQRFPEIPVCLVLRPAHPMKDHRYFFIEKQPSKP